jgi:hypothetical protein
MIDPSWVAESLGSPALSCFDLVDEPVQELVVHTCVDDDANPLVAGLSPALITREHMVFDSPV